MKTLLLALPLIWSLNSAAADNLTFFFDASVGSWAGPGTVSIQTGNAPAKNYKLTVEQKVTEEPNQEWTYSTLTKGMPVSAPATITQYQISGTSLKVISTQYAVIAKVSKSAPIEIDLSTVHADPVTGGKTTVVRTMKLVGADQMEITSDVTGPTVKQHFEYHLKKVPAPAVK